MARFKAGNEKKKKKRKQMPTPVSSNSTDQLKKIIMRLKQGTEQYEGRIRQLEAHVNTMKKDIAYLEKLRLRM